VVILGGLSFLEEIVDFKGFFLSLGYGTFIILGYDIIMV